MKEFFIKHAPEILTGLAVAGVAASVVAAIKATPKALRLIEEAEDEKNGPLTKKEVLKTTYKCYIPTACIALGTIAAIVGATTVSTKRTAVMTALYTASETTAKIYEKKVVEAIGENANKKIHEEMVKEKMEANPPENSTIIITGNGDSLCMDAWSGRYFETNIEKVRAAVNTINAQIIDETWATVNDFYDLLNLSHTKGGSDTGWTYDHLLDVKFASALTPEGKPCLTIEYEAYPLPYLA